jgi:hypothetical protein
MKGSGSFENINWMCNLRGRASGISMKEDKNKGKPRWNAVAKK